MGHRVVGEVLIDGDHYRYRCIELTEASHDPVLTTFLVISFDTHGLEQLDGNLDLTVAVHTLIPVARHLDLTIDSSPSEHAFGVAFANQFQRCTRDRVEVPRLSIHRGWRTFGHCDDVFHKFSRNRVWFVAPGAAPRRNQCFEVHDFTFQILCQ